MFACPSIHVDPLDNAEQLISVRVIAYPFLKQQSVNLLIDKFHTSSTFIIISSTTVPCYSNHTLWRWGGLQPSSSQRGPSLPGQAAHTVHTAASEPGSRPACA